MPIIQISVMRRKRTILRKKAEELADSIADIGATEPDSRAMLLTQIEILRDQRSSLEKMDAEILSHPNLREDEVDGELEEAGRVGDKLREAIQSGSVRATANAAHTEHTPTPVASPATMQPSAAANAFAGSRSSPADGSSCVAPSVNTATSRSLHSLLGFGTTAAHTASANDGRGASLTSMHGLHSPATATSSANSTATPPAHSPTTQPVAMPITALTAVDNSIECFGDGNGLPYKTFKAQFAAWCRRRPNATALEKLLQLISKLRGAPRDIVESLEITDENFEVAIRLLDKNFGRDEDDRRRAIDRIDNVPQVRSANDTAGLRALLTYVEATSLQLQALGVQPVHYALSFERRVRQALPDQLVYDFDNEIYRDNQRRINDPALRNLCPATEAHERLTQLVDRLWRYTTHREQLTPTTSGKEEGKLHRNKPASFTHDKSKGHQRQGNKEPPRNRLQATVAAANQPQRAQPQRRQQQSRQPDKPCFFCGDVEHRPSRCTAKMSLQQRKAVLDKKGKCHTCFAAKHQGSTRCMGTKAPCSQCQSREHYTSMHYENDAVVSAPASVVAAASAVSTLPLVMTASAFVTHAGSEIPVRVFFDTGSMMTFVNPELLKRLPELRPSGRADLTIQGINAERTLISDRYRLRLRGRFDNAPVVEIMAYAHEFDVNPANDCSPDTLQAIRDFNQRYPIADVAYLNDVAVEAPAILLGMDHLYSIVKRSMRNVTKGIVATDSAFGWLIAGAATPRSTRVDIARAHTVCCGAALSKPARDIERLWTTEVLGIEDLPPTVHSVEEADAVQQFESGLRYDGSSYTVSIPKRASITTLQNNLGQALRRLDNKRQALLRNPDIFKRYDDELMMFVRKGFASRVEDFNPESAGRLDGTYYMPHHQVVTKKDDGSEKWRIVFDCSAAVPGTSSLNTHLLTGPSLNPDIVTLLMNFRTQPVAVSADVTQAYMRINVHEKDCRFFRFLWQGPDDSKVKCYQMNRVTWGAAPSGFLLAAVLRQLFKRVDPDGTLRLGDSFYHDDMLRSFATDQDAIQFIDKIIAWLGSAGMQLAKWKTNSPVVLEHLRQKGIRSADACSIEGALLKVLGVAWTPTRDELKVQLASLAGEGQQISKATKRTVLRFVASIYDPVGWLTPFTVRGKQLIQRLWNESLKWDDPLPDDCLSLFKEWAAELSVLTDLHIPRYYGSCSRDVASHHLHIFGDASETAYAAVAYLQTNFSDGSSHCAFVMAKSRLAPRKKMTLPRLELMAALISTRLRTFLLDRLAIKIDYVSHYTDSSTVYHWCTVARPTRWKEFVCNRVTEIQRASSREEWFHVDGIENTADFATRGVTADQLKNHRDWWQGPQWLAEPVDRRPCRKLQPTVTTDENVAGEQRVIAAPIVPAEPCVDLARFGSLETALRVVGNVITASLRMRRRQTPTPAECRAQAERWLIKWTQSQYYAEEIAMTQRQERPPSRSPLAQYQLIVDNEGVLRIQTRLVRDSLIPYDEANPIVLPGQSLLARLLIIHHHRTNAHFGVNVILSALRRRFWITRGRQVIKALLNRCTVCRRVHGPSGDQVQAPLPTERTRLVVPFGTTGLDYCGPFRVRTGKTTTKTYIALFVCMTTRAIHLELVSSMSTPTTLLALRRFLAAHPGCTYINSDNGRSFRKAATDIKKLFNSIKEPECRELLERRQIEWSFNCPRAAWRGGHFERLVGTTKVALTKTLGKSLVSAEELRTIITELAAVINDRPLTYTGSDTDSPRPITPAQFLHGGPVGPPLASITSLDRLGPDGATTPPPGAEELRRAARQRTSYFRALSVRWYREYLLQLRLANNNATGRAREIKVGDVCVLKEDNLPRIRWNLVRILDAVPGRDGAVRTYGVRFANGHISRRAAQLLHPLEVV